MLIEGGAAQAAPRSNTPSARFWWLYWLAWLPFGAVYMWAANAALGWYRLVVIGLFNVLPAALGGVVVIRRARRWEGASEPRFWVRELGFLVFLAGAATAATYGLFATHRFVEEGIFASYTFRPVGVAWRLADRLLIYAFLAALLRAFQMALRLRDEENRALRAVALRKETELKVLCAQLKPHFLFNSLQSLIALTRQDPKRAEEGLTRMGDLMHFCLSAQSRAAEEVPLERELELVETYLSLERMRLGDRLRAHWDVDPAACECWLPSFTLQPLIENAVGHAIAPRKEGGQLWIRARVRGDHLLVTVRDDGPGASPAVLEVPGRFGLRLIRERLQVLYGDRASMEIDASGPAGFTVSLAIPARMAPAFAAEAMAS